MSRLFDALQRSESERAGISFVESAVTATEVLESAERDITDFGQLSSTPIRIEPKERVVSLTRKESLAAEKFRFLAVRLRALQQGCTLKTLLVTSTIAEEGKTLVATNLAVMLARKKRQKVLLMEGDLRRPALAETLGMGNLTGMSEWLRDGASAAPQIYYVEEPGFWAVPAGRPPDNPLELMQSGKLSAVMDQLTTWFDWIVIDSPPVLPLADTSVWMRLADGILLVAREGKTEKLQLKRGVEALETSKLLGVVLNDSTSTDHRNYYQRYYAANKRAQQDHSEHQST